MCVCVCVCVCAPMCGSAPVPRFLCDVCVCARVRVCVCVCVCVPMCGSSPVPRFMCDVMCVYVCDVI